MTTARKTWTRYWGALGAVTGAHYVIEVWHKDGRYQRLANLTERQMSSLERLYRHNGYRR